MSEVCGSMVREKWYQKHIFPLVPIIKLSKGDEHNSRRIFINWTFFILSDSMTPFFRFNVYAEDHGVGIQAGAFYVSFNAKIPFPYSVSRWGHKWFWRVGARSKFKWMR